MKIKFGRKEVSAVHFGSARGYTWSVPDGMDIKAGDIAWVDTEHGEQLVQVISVMDSRGVATKSIIGRVSSIEVEDGEEGV